MTHFKNYKPLMAYLDPNDITRLRSYSKDTNIPMAQLIREGVKARLSGGNTFASGYNDGLTKAISVIHDMRPAQMRFPSGASFAEIVETELVKHMWREPTEGSNEEAGIV